MAMVLHAVVTGNPAAAAPLVLLHGFGGGAFVWRDITEALGAEVAVIAYDLPGHGGSLAADGLGGAGRMAKAVLADLDRRGVGRFHLAGHSLGGATAALLALRLPERVASLAMMAPGGFGPAINHRALHHFATAASEAALLRALEVMTGFNGRVRPEAIAAMLASRRVPGALRALETVFEAMFVDPAAAARIQGTLPLDGFGALPMPVRMLWGEEDCILPVGQSENLADSITICRLRGAGHMLIDEAADAVLSMIVANLEAAL